jgi:hypothetical protein
MFAALMGLGALIMTVAAGLAHHSAAMFEPTKTITVEGVVKEWQLTNPHSWLLVEVTGKDGKTVSGVLSGRAQHLVARRHQAQRSESGYKLTITGRPMKDGQKAAIWVSATRADGKKLDPAAGFATKG